MSELGGLRKHENNQHALVLSKTECGYPSGRGINNSHVRYPSNGGMQKKRKDLMFYCLPDEKLMPRLIIMWPTLTKGGQRRLLSGKRTWPLLLLPLSDHNQRSDSYVAISTWRNDFKWRSTNNSNTSWLVTRLPQIVYSLVWVLREEGRVEHEVCVYMAQKCTLLLL